MPRGVYNNILEEVSSDIEEREGITDYKARILIGGSMSDRADLIGLIEELGGVVVTDTFCTGTRWFRGLVEEEGDPLDAISRRYYYEHALCPRLFTHYE